MTRMTHRWGFWALVLLGLAGCSEEKPRRTEDPDTSNLRRIVQAIGICADVKERGPLDETELKHWLGQLGEPGTPDEFIVSRRDKQPFVVYYGHMINPAGGDTVLAHEKDGADGKRFVLTISGYVKAFSDEEFAKARFPAKKSP